MNRLKPNFSGWRQAGASFFAVLLLATIATGMTGCLVGTDGRGSAVVWFPVAGHVHDDNCGHYCHHDTWYAADGHHHCSGCGHAYVNGLWIVRD